ncbi:MAG: aspartate--ammonia ligase, partial [Lachnospiraceae bacterium]|nr:aspartate--ammonia ligase [Lachnospiraceae bacterium]
SIYVDQWDWEKVIEKTDRNEETLRSTVKNVYEALRVTEKHMSNLYDYIDCFLPEEISFVTSQELLDRWPDKSSKEREYLIAKEKGAVFIMKIGDLLSNGERHDGRAPDYDDWQLNGDIIVYYPVTDIALELSSMGIRVDEDSLAEQLKKAGCEDRAKLPFQKAILDRKLPYTIGGGIGQSRICMFFLRKCHIGEVQVSIWPEEEIEYARERGVIIL